MLSGQSCFSVWTHVIKEFYGRTVECSPPAKSVIWPRMSEHVFHLLETRHSVERGPDHTSQGEITASGDVWAQTKFVLTCPVAFFLMSCITKLWLHSKSHLFLYTCSTYCSCPYKVRSVACSMHTGTYFVITLHLELWPFHSHIALKC